MKLPERPAAPAANIDLYEVGNPKHNAFWFACAVDGGRVNYASCMTKAAIIGTSTSADGYTSWPECRKAIRCDNCLFTQMRKQELDEGKAIWFVPREGFDPVADAMKPAPTHQWVMPTQAPRPKSNWRTDPAIRITNAPAPTKPAAKDLSYASAINNYMADSVAEKQRHLTPSDVNQSDVKSIDLSQPKPAPVIAASPANGSSLLARARAMIAARNNQ